MRLSSLLLFVAVFSCCKPVPIPQEPPIVIVEPTDGGTEAAHRSKCAIACDHMRLLRCAEGADKNCEKVCELSPKSRISAFDVDCADVATDLKHMRTCGVRCAQ